MQITKPGIFYDMPCDEYFADPCPLPSMTQSIAKKIIEKSPLHAWHCHPRLNPDFQADDDTKFDIGNIAHSLLLGRGKSIEVLEFDDWRTKAAQEARKVAAMKGKIAVLWRHHQRARRMVDAAQEQIGLRRLARYFDEEYGASEVVVAWKEDDLWFRQMIDRLSGSTFLDYKTTDMSVAPHCLSRMMAAAGWHIQAAMGERGLRMVSPPRPRLRFLFIVQETAPPYQLSVVEIGESALTMGRKMLQRAIDIWGRCMADNVWPGYPTQIIVPEFPGWAESQWLEREETEFNPNLIMAG